MQRGMCAVVAGLVMAFVGGSALAGRQEVARQAASQEFDVAIGDVLVPSLRGTYPAAPLQLPMVATLLTGQGFLLSEASAKPVWANGELDGISGLASQSGVAAVADDFFLTEGFDYKIEKVELVMAVLPVGPVTGTLYFYEDCNGAPGAVIGSAVATEILNIGTNPNFPGLTFYRFVFDNLNWFQEGGKRYWISPIGASQGLYFWLTSGSGAIQGGQGKYLSPAYGFPTWTDVDETGHNFGLCTDFNFRICGKECCKIHDTGDFSLAGFASQGFPGGLLFISNAFDNFQTPPGEAHALCRLEFYFATNCDPDRVYVEFYDNDCDMPSGVPVRLDSTSPGWRDPEQLFSEPGVPLLVEGLRVYKFVIECPGVEFRGERNYWFTAALHWIGTPHERGLWLFGPLSDCAPSPFTLGGGAEYRIEITEGRWRSDFLGVPMFAPISDVLNTGMGISQGTSPSRKRDFSFRMWLCQGSGQMLVGGPLFSIIGSGGWEGQLNPETPLPALPAPIVGGPGGVRP